MRPRLLDLFCGAGGAAMGYHRAGFEVVGVDIEPQPHYPFGFVQADALTFPLKGFAAIHASPPCQAYTTGNARYPHAKERHERLIPAVRDLLKGAGVPWVMENVVGASRELRHPVLICGRSVGLPRLARHRLFECSFPLMVAPCTCSGRDTVGVYGERPDGRALNSRYPTNRAATSLSHAQEIMGMPWGDWHGVKEAIPPAYAELIGLQLLAYL